MTEQTVFRAGEMDPRPGASKSAPHTCDVFVERSGLVYITDFNAGLHILEWNGA